MNQMSGARVATVAGLAAGALGIVIQRIAGVAMPAIPPGLVLLVGAAALVAATKGRWAPAIGALVALSEIAGVAIVGVYQRLFDLDEPLVAAGTWVRVVGIVVAFAAGVVATAARTPAASAVRT